MSKTNNYSQNMQRITDDILMSSGKTSSTLRQAITAQRGYRFSPGMRYEEG